MRRRSYDNHRKVSRLSLLLPVPVTARPICPVQCRLSGQRSSAGSAGGGRGWFTRRRRFGTVLGRGRGRNSTAPISPGIQLGHSPSGGLPTGLAGGLAPGVGSHAERPGWTVDRGAESDFLRLARATVDTTSAYGFKRAHRLVTRLPKFVLRHLARITASGMTLVWGQARFHLGRLPAGDRASGITCRASRPGSARLRPSQQVGFAIKGPAPETLKGRASPNACQLRQRRGCSSVTVRTEKQGRLLAVQPALNIRYHPHLLYQAKAHGRKRVSFLPIYIGGWRRIASRRRLG